MQATSIDADELKPAPSGTLPVIERLKGLTSALGAPDAKSSRKHGDHAQRVVAPVMRALRRQRIERVLDGLVEVVGVDDDPCPSSRGVMAARVSKSMAAGITKPSA